MNALHGGDIYRNKVNIDFSVSVNPFGAPESVKKAIADSVEFAGNYPDICCEALTNALAERLSLPADNIICGNGASELIMAFALALRPKKAVIPVPSFAGYKRALENTGCSFRYVPMENDFLPGKSLFDELKDGTDMLVLASPNNPTGKYIPREMLTDILDICEEKKIAVLLDECFMELSRDPEKNTVIHDINRWKQLTVLRSFTKTFAVPAVRLGYTAGSNTERNERIRSILPEWNVSAAAQAAGEAALKEENYVVESRKYINSERKYLSDTLKSLGFKVIESDANYILFFTESLVELKEKLLDEGILIRDCSNFEGIEKGWFRIAVKKHKDNIALIDTIKRLG